MLMRLSHDIGLYFYDVLVARFDVWAAFGVIAQLIFGARFIVQWIASEKAEKSVIPVGFWFLSIGGGLMTLIYGFVRHDIVIILGQAFSVFIYVRNLMLIAKDARKKASRVPKVGEAEAS
ncbi:lipid-A-disaccharide synthase N-terminal domain-containing protein [Microvirga sp. 2MCAF38]|uniref:lipid-A-disaccharide synthase N-terminal domain-containing protein n=1 Tax=Microvirga sp. 2MCAF38 TaxID=3232989 RepID=UPI003F950AB5